jgi:hypothetical protein
MREEKKEHGVKHSKGTPEGARFIADDYTPNQNGGNGVCHRLSHGRLM